MSSMECIKLFKETSAPRVSEHSSTMYKAQKCTTAITIRHCHGIEKGFDRYWSHSSGVPFLILNIFTAAVVRGIASMS